MNGYRLLETGVLMLAMVASSVYALVHLVPARVANWRRGVLLWLIAERRPAMLRELGRRLARRGQAAAVGSCGSCKGCAPGK